MKQKLHYYLIRFFTFLGMILPKSMLYALNRWILLLFYSKKKVRRDITHANLKKGFPNLSESDIEDIAKSVYVELSKTITEVMLINANRLNIQKSIVNADEALGKLRNISKNATGGIIFITAHYGNWELLCHWMAQNDFPLLGVVKEGNNRYIEQNIVIPFRAKYGNASIAHSRSMLSITKALRNRKNVILAIDQVVQPPNGVPVKFFNHPTAATKSVAILKNKYNPKIVPIFIKRVDVERFEIGVVEPVEVDLDIEYNENKLVYMTQMYYDIIEEQIRQTPEQWLWLYNRWKRIKNV